jgi:hypothetical protein
MQASRCFKLDVSRQPARFVEMRPDLVGGATWTYSHGAYHARLRGDRLEVIDATDPAHAELTSSTDRCNSSLPGSRQSR